jgi:hypothetical protein
MTIDAGRFNWFEQLSTDPRAAERFYTETLPWKTQTLPMGPTGYTMLLAGEQGIGGLTDLPKHMDTPHWISYVSVEDVVATARKVVGNGGKALMDAFEMPGVGKMQPVADPMGAAFFLFCPIEGDKPAVKGPGAFFWNELWCDDAKAAADFYAKVLGYTYTTMDTPTGPYYVLANGERQRAGIMTSPVTGIPAHWLPYVDVADLEASLARVTRNKGAVEGDVMQMPGIGRFAFIRDAQGARLGLITPANR